MWLQGFESFDRLGDVRTVIYTVHPSSARSGNSFLCGVPIYHPTQLDSVPIPDDDKLRWLRYAVLFSVNRVIKPQFLSSLSHTEIRIVVGLQYGSHKVLALFVQIKPNGPG